MIPDRPFRAVRVPQDRETPPRVAGSGRLRWTWAYARAAETQQADEVGQDCLVFEDLDGGLTFALCDGVSQSFFGDLAATALAEALVEWIGRAVSPGADREELAASLDVMLRKLCGPVTEEVAGFPMPGGLAPLVADVLEEKRRLGSESTFVCGRVRLPGPDLPQGQLFLAWLGDCRCRLWRGGRELPPLGPFLTEQRWSSVRGAVGSPPHLHLGPLDVERVTVYSDGLASLDRHASPPGPEGLQRVIEEAGRQPASDDISYLDVAILP